MSRYTANIITRNPATPTGPTTTGRAPGIWRLDEVAYWKKQGLWPDPSIVPDQYYPYVSLLLSSTSLSNANNNLFVDSSGAFNPVSRFGNTTQGSFTPYSTNWSNFFDGSGDFLSAPSNAAFDLGGGDFTIECWFNANSFAAAFGLVSRYSVAPAGWFLRVINATTIRFYRADVASDITVSTMAVGAWYHVAAVRSGTTVTIYLNGSSVGTITGVNNFTDATGTTVQIGRTHTVTDDINGYISNLRVVKGTAVYTANFTPPTAPLTAISGTSLLTCQSNRFRDASSNNFTITPTGSTSVQDFGPFNPTYPGAVYNQSDITNWSGYFSSGNYLGLPNSTSLKMGSGDFTAEAWVYLTSYGSPFGGIINTCSNTVSANGFSLIVSSSGQLRFFSYVSTAYVADGAVIPLNQWVHIAATRASGTLRLFCDGAVSTAVSNSENFDGDTSGGGIGGWVGNNSGSVNGYISNVRIVKGTAVYTANFTPPTAPLTAISGTSLLTCQNAAFTDNSTNNFVLVQNGNPTVTGNSPFNTVGYWSNYFDGNDYIQTPDNAAFAFGTGDYTVEAWVYPTSIRNGENLIYVTEVTQGLAFGYNQTQVYIGARATAYDLLATYTMPTNQWVHVAATRQSGTARIFVNGTQVGSGTITRSNPQGPGTVGDYTGGSNGNGVTGYLSNVRVIKGTALYTSNFTVPTAPLTAVSGTSLLTCQNGRFIDNSANNFAITRTGDVSVQSFDPFYTATIASNGGSMYFDGSGDYLRGANSPAFAFGTGDFTVEMWAYFMDPSATNRPLFDNGATSNTGRLLIRQGNDGGVANVVNAFVSGTTASSPTIQFYSWTHVAVVRQSGTVRIYINGVGGTGVTATADLSQNACLLGAFYDQLAWNFTGYMSNVRVTKGTAVYTANFTPPTAPLTPSANTTLLVNGMNAGIYDATTNNDMETVGNAQVSTVQSKFGGSSLYFDGSGDYLVPANRDAGVFGTGAFTVECWIYATGAPQSNQVIWSCNSYPNTTGLYVAYYGSGSTQLSVATGATTLITASGGWTFNQWVHVAVVRSGTTLTLYLDGTARGSTTFSNNCTDGLTFIGRPSDVANYMMQGYIDDLRITKGVARYTANFTPPTQPFPVY